MAFEDDASLPTSCKISNYSPRPLRTHHPFDRIVVPRWNVLLPRLPLLSYAGYLKTTLVFAKWPCYEMTSLLIAMPFADDFNFIETAVFQG